MLLQTKQANKMQITKEDSQLKDMNKENTTVKRQLVK